ncbi:MAG: M3 family metallopeptidase [Candidatus Eutrophobiaceae bacterium]
MENPLLNEDLLPLFSKIQPKHIAPAIDSLLDGNRLEIARILAENKGNYTWENTMAPLEELEDRLNRAWSPISHMHSVADNEELRAAYNDCLPKLSDYATEMGQSRDLFAAYQAVSDNHAALSLNPAQRKIMENALRDFRLSGIDLPGPQRERYRQIQQELSKMEVLFEENLLDATNAWKRHVTDPSEIAGLPESMLQLARAAAQSQDGWLFTLDFPNYAAVMQYAENPALRETFYRAWNARASGFGAHDPKWDNTDLIPRILSLRTEKAQLLGFKSYAHLSLATKMAETPEQVLKFLSDLVAQSRSQAQREHQEVLEFARSEFGVEQLQPWDLSWYSQRLRSSRYEYSPEDLRPWFALSQVLDGLFEVVSRLYGIHFRQRTGVDVWHEDVRFYDLLDADGGVLGGFYLDPCSRKEKRGGAWMDECRIRRMNGGVCQQPIAYLSCNFTPASPGKPILLLHDEAITLFHEFGHGLHHMLTQVDYAGVSGISGVPWDAVELPSQFMENWCWERASLDLFAKHVETGEGLGDAMYGKLKAAKNFQSAMQMMRQLEFSLFDFRLHLEFAENPEVSVHGLLEEVRKQVAVVFPPEFNRFENGFSHIFAGGYAAGYYSYKWAEVLSADAFSKFEEHGVFDRATGMEFRQNVLEKGGSEEPMELFMRFRGRPPSVNALLRHSGIGA